MIAGDTLGVHNDGYYDLDAPCVVDLLERNGISWLSVQENYPGSVGNCWNGVKSSDGLYVRKHNPFMSFTSISRTKRCDRIVEASALDELLNEYEKTGVQNLPQFIFYTPNMDNDAHDTSACLKITVGFLCRTLSSFINSKV